MIMKKFTLIVALLTSTTLLSLAQTESASSNNRKATNGLGYQFQFDGLSSDNCPNNIPYDAYYFSSADFTIAAGSGSMVVDAGGSQQPWYRINLRMYNGSCASVDQTSINLSANANQRLEMKINASVAMPNFSVQFSDINDRWSSNKLLSTPLIAGDNIITITDASAIEFKEYNAAGPIAMDSSQIINVGLFPGVVAGRFTVDYVRLGDVTSLVTANKPAVVESSLSYFPNPVKDQLTVNYKYTGSSEVALSDMSGNVVKKVSVSGYDNSVVFNTKDLQSGIYLLSIITEQGVVSKKIAVTGN